MATTSVFKKWRGRRPWTTLLFDQLEKNDRQLEALQEVFRRTALLIQQNTGRWDPTLEHDARTMKVLETNQEIIKRVLNKVDTSLEKPLRFSNDPAVFPDDFTAPLDERTTVEMMYDRDHGVATAPQFPDNLKPDSISEEHWKQCLADSQIKG